MLENRRIAKETQRKKSEEKRLKDIEGSNETVKTKL
jgi:hypothetical protein